MFKYLLLVVFVAVKVFSIDDAIVGWRVFNGILALVSSLNHGLVDLPRVVTLRFWRSSCARFALRPHSSQNQTSVGNINKLKRPACGTSKQFRGSSAGLT